MNIKDAYIHNGEAILKDIQVSGSKLQKLKAGKDANDAYLTWVDVLDLSSFGASGHNHDDLYLKLAGGTMSGDITFPYEKGLIYNLPTLSSYARSMLLLKAKKTTSDANVSNVFSVGYRVAADGYKYTYIGGGNYDSTDNLRFNADNSITIGTNVVYHAGNLNIGTLMGSTAIGDSDEPVYWSGTAFVKAGAYPTKSSWNYDDVYLKLSGGTLTGDLTIKSNSGDSPKLIFQRGTLTDSLDDWRIFDTGGNLKFQHTTGSSTNWQDYVIFSATAGTVTINGNKVWHAGNDGSGSTLDADTLDGFHAADFRNNIVDLRTSPQTFNPTYLKDIVFISEADYTSLVSNGSITKNSITHTYNSSNWYVIPDKVPEYAETAGSVAWSNVTSKPDTATRWPSWSEVTGKPSTFAPSSHTHYATRYQDSRNTAMTPTNAVAVNGLAIDFKTKANGVNAGSGLYCGLVTMDPYSDASGGYPMQMGFNTGADANNTNELYIRTAKDADTWNEWRTVITSANIESQTVNSATTATYASNVGTSADHVTAAQVKALHTWYTTVAGNNASGVIDNWNEIKNFIDGFHETDDLATYLTNTFLAKSGGTMTGPIKWTDSTALPEQTSPQYFVCIDAFNSGGTTKWASKANTLKALTGLTSTAIGDSDEPVYWDGSKFVKAGAYPTKASWNYDDVYLKLSGGTLTGALEVPSSTSSGGEHTKGLNLGSVGHLGAVSATGATGVGLYSTEKIWIRPGQTNIASGTVDTTKGLVIDATTFTYNGNTVYHSGNLPATATSYGYVGTTAVQGSSTAQNLTGIKDATFSGVLNITGRQSYAEGIRIHDYSGISSIWFRAVNADNYDAGMIGITADSTGLRFRLPASATGTSVADKVKIAYGGNVSITNALTVSGDFTASAAVYFTGLSSGSSDVTDDTELLTSYAGTSGFANTTGAGQVYRRQATKLYNYIKSKTDNLYVTSVDVTDDTTDHANQLRYVKGGSSTYFTVPFATNADTVDTYHAERLLHGAYNSSVVYDVLEIKQSNTPTEILIKTKLPFSNGNEMPSIYIRGFAYGNSVPVDIHLVFYIYGGAFCNCSATCYGVWKPQIFLFTYVENETTYVGIGLKKSIYYPRFYVDLADIWGNNGSRYHAGWTYEINTSSETTIIPEDNKKELEYKALDTSILGSAGSVAWTNITGKPDTFPVENIYLKLAGGTMTGAAPINFTRDKIAINFRPDSASYYSKVQYMTAGNEALVFSNVSSVTSFIFKCGYNLENGSNWNSIFDATTNIPSVQIKKQSLYVNAFINTNVNPDYNFYVGGTAAFTGQITSTVAVGTKPFIITSTTLNDNLNADLLDGKHAADFATSGHDHDTSYVKLDAGAAEQTIKNSIGNISNGSIEIWRATSGGYPMIGFATGATKTKLGFLGFGATANEPLFRNTSGTDYKLLHSGNYTTYTVKKDGTGASGTWGISITGSAGSVAWANVSDRPDFTTWSETSSTATYSLSNATWTQTITLPTTVGSYILKLVSGNSTLTGVFSIGASDNAKDEISLHLHGNGPRLYARTNGTKLELSRNIATATNTSVTITYRRMI